VNGQRACPIGGYDSGKPARTRRCQKQIWNKFLTERDKAVFAASGLLDFDPYPFVDELALSD